MIFPLTPGKRAGLCREMVRVLPGDVLVIQLLLLTVRGQARLIALLRSLAVQVLPLLTDITTICSLITVARIVLRQPLAWTVQENLNVLVHAGRFNAIGLHAITNQKAKLVFLVNSVSVSLRIKQLIIMEQLRDMLL